MLYRFFKKLEHNMTQFQRAKHLEIEIRQRIRFFYDRHGCTLSELGPIPALGGFWTSHIYLVYRIRVD